MITEPDDEDINNAIEEISAEVDPDGCCRYRDVLSDRQALQNATWAIVHSLRQARDAFRACNPK